MSIRNLILGISGMLLLTACHDIPFYSVYKLVDVTGWQTKDTLVYRLPEQDELRDAKVTFGIRLSRQFHYENIVLVARMFEGKKLVSSDTLNIKVLDEYGEHIGNGLNYVVTEKELDHQYLLKPGKKYKLKIHHIMRQNPFDGVSGVGVTLE